MKIKEVIKKLQEFDEELELYADDQCGGFYNVSIEYIQKSKVILKSGKEIEAVFIE